MKREIRKSSFKNALFWVFLFFYETASAKFWLFPPLMGLAFVYLIVRRAEFEKFIENPNLTWYGAFLFLIFCEQLHGFKMFSSLLAFLIFYYMIYDWLIINLKWRESLLVIMVVSGYSFTFLINNLILYIANSPGLEFSGEYVFYAVAESALAIAFFRDKVL